MQIKRHIAYKEVVDSIPKKLRDGNILDLGRFNEKIKNMDAYKESGGWRIEKDRDGHKGSKWKLKNKSNKRVASLDDKGRVVGK